MRDAPEEKRRGPRRRVLKGAIVAYNDRHSTMPCFVRDISDTGARLRMDCSMSPPDTFLLIIELDGIEVDCEVVANRPILPSRSPRPCARLAQSERRSLRLLSRTPSPPCDASRSQSRHELTTVPPALQRFTPRASPQFSLCLHPKCWISCCKTSHFSAQNPAKITPSASRYVYL